MSKKLSKIQSILLSRDIYPTMDDAIGQIQNMGFHMDYGIDPTENYWRFRQFPPTKKYKYKMKNINEGIKFVIAY